MLWRSIWDAHISLYYAETYSYMMKACIFDIKRFAIHDGPGIRVTVFFKGCPLSCKWCHNPEGIPQGIYKHSETVDFDGVQIKRDVDVGRWVDSIDLIFMDESGGGVTFSGGEPLLQPEALMDLLDLCRERGMHTTVDTSGYGSKKVMLEVCKRSDLILFDLKSVNDARHTEYTGMSNNIILGNLDIVLHSGTETIIRIPLVPGFNDDASEIRDMLDYLARYERPAQVDILPYHSYANHKYKKFQTRMEPFTVPSPELIREVQEAFESVGYRVTTGG